MRGLWDKGRDIHFPGFYVRERERERRRKKESKFLSSILGMPSIGIRRAKSESSSTRRGYTCVPKRKDFTEDSKEEISRNQGFRVKEASHPCYYASIGRGSSYFGLFSL